MARPEVKRGDIWLIDLGLAQKIRPAVILSVAYLDHERALIPHFLNLSKVSLPTSNWKCQELHTDPH